jgi:formate-dependent nitrite reductase membrane component NrfD
MNLFVAEPHWGWWIIGYFYLGGIAAGAYFTAMLIDLLAREEDRPLARVGYWIAFPLVSVCGVFLILDLGRPERFWHMLFKSEVVEAALEAGWPTTRDGWALMWQAPLLKHWSPMSVGSWALLIFGGCSFLSVLGSLWQTGTLSWLFRRSLFAKLFQVVGCAVGFFVAAYTGALLTASSQPFWSDTTWIAPLFLTSAASTGIAALTLLNRLRRTPSAEALHDLDRADLWAVGLEGAIFLAFVASVSAIIWPLLSTWQGALLLLGTPVVGLLIPLILQLRFGGRGGFSAVAAALFALAGGFILRYSIVTTREALLAGEWKHSPVQKVVSRFVPENERLGEGRRETSPAHQTVPEFRFSPEQGRKPGERGADPLNRPNPEKPSEIKPRSKMFTNKP